MDSILSGSSYATHQELLEAAYREHERVREDALLYLEKIRLENEVLKEQTRLKQEQTNRQLAEEAIALAQQSIPLPQQTLPSPLPRAKTPPTPKTVLASPLPTANSPVKIASSTPATAPVPPQSPLKSLPATISQTKTPTTEEKANSDRPITQFIPAQPKPPVPIQTTDAIHPGVVESVSYLLPGISGKGNYIQIHKALKDLRKNVIQNSKTNPNLKGKVGDMRRAIRVAVGQLTDVKGANRDSLAKIQNVLKESLTLPSPPVDPRIFMLTPPPPSGQDDSLPSLTVYLLNIFAKVVVKQFIEEAGANQKAAEPIGVIAITVFARKDFHFKDCSLIDILMAKMRVVCPVIFGVRGNDNTENGRAAQGWHKDEGGWASEQVHNTRMTGLGAGYAAISLRDFGKTAMTNPWPPSYYWRSLAAIVSTPRPSGTQYLVVKAMIDGYEQKFLTFYGTAARAALQAALIEFPKRDQNKTVAASSLRTLADKLRKDVGLMLKGSI